MFIAITGPTGAGKSTVSKKLIKPFDKSVLIDVDVVKHFVVNGVVYGHVDISSQGHEQWKLLGNNLGLLVQNYVKARYTTILEGFLTEEGWKEAYRHIQPDYKFLIFPNKTATVKRDRLRDINKQHDPKIIDEHYEYFLTRSFFEEFIKIDSSMDTVEETAQKILSQII